MPNIIKYLWDKLSGRAGLLQMISELQLNLTNLNDDLKKTKAELIISRRRESWDILKAEADIVSRAMSAKLVSLTTFGEKVPTDFSRQKCEDQYILTFRVRYPEIDIARYLAGLAATCRIAHSELLTINDPDNGRRKQINLRIDVPCSLLHGRQAQVLLINEISRRFIKEIQDTLSKTIEWTDGGQEEKCNSLAENSAGFITQPRYNISCFSEPLKTVEVKIERTKNETN